MFQLEKRPTTAASIGPMLLTAVFVAVAISFGARAFIAYDYARLDPGDKVTSIYGGNGYVRKIEDGIVTIEDKNGRIKTSPIEQVTEQ